ncbi:hypothetical protein L581_4288 [Serratia fonticola AU-AP2C]|nr:hypothetical protein L581_4288 [Serratia fonticola AU-AP2C]
MVSLSSAGTSSAAIPPLLKSPANKIAQGRSLLLLGITIVIIPFI